MRRFFQFAVGLTFIFTVSASYALPEYTQERKLFKQAQNFLQKSKLPEFRKIKAQLSDYPLQPYLEYDFLIKYRGTAKQSTITGFIEDNQALPLANRLNRTWLNHLVKQKRWQDYIKHYDNYPVESSRYICQYHLAQLNGSSSQKKNALYAAKELWLVGHSQPKNCDPLFKAWMKTGRPTSSEAYTRFKLSLEEGNTKLARYIDKKITDPKHKKHSKQFWKVYSSPSLIASKQLKKLPEPLQASTAVLTYKKWFRSHPISATEAWLKQRKNYSDEIKDEITAYMALRLNSRYHSDAISLSKKLDPEYKLTDITEVRIRNALAHQDWKAVVAGVNNLPASEKEEARWQYWQAVANSHLDPKNKISESLQQISTDRSFYGFLAAELSDTPFLLNAVSSQPPKAGLKALESQPAVLRTRELFLLGMLTEANREWNGALAAMNDSEKQAAGYLAKSWGWHLQAIINAAKTKRWDHIDLRFPQPHKALFNKYARKNNLDLNFPLAIARQESAFLHNAQSRVGARGLMQLMPKTAKATARKHKVKYTRRSQLYTPELNITLGSAYLGDMYKKFNNNPAFAAAAYNAGPHRVKRWLKDRGALPLDIWIETIPFKETRNYVQNVLAFRVIYDRLQGRQAKLLSDKQIQLLALKQNDKISL